MRKHDMWLDTLDGKSYRIERQVTLKECENRREHIAHNGFAQILIRQAHGEKLLWIPMTSVSCFRVEPPAIEPDTPWEDEV